MVVFMLFNGITNCWVTAFFPFPSVYSIKISASVTVSSLPSFMVSSVKVTSTVRPIFFTYWRCNCKGSSMPGEESSKENSPSGYIPDSSICLYSLRLKRTHFSMVMPLSPSINTLKLLVGLTFKDTKKYSGSSASMLVSIFSIVCKTVSFAIPKRRRER